MTIKSDGAMGSFTQGLFTTKYGAGGEQWSSQMGFSDPLLMPNIAPYTYIATSDVVIGPHIGAQWPGKGGFAFGQYGLAVNGAFKAIPLGNYVGTIGMGAAVGNRTISNAVVDFYGPPISATLKSANFVNLPCCW
jgi:hypothetical protein